ncbi:hypothetical protein [Geothermobacter hydrogeniphilus]|uniref:Uncharacterized protein n=1 Tax=Geothermobacter hydrogeniphilus TaxID=1969733 RepID=A0A1X0Y0G9_9BACT|nr:hypothetical protein [Geothermobacter hydrogeniphilus]ORJ58681.1 hypothetical protein B5V00_11300 [Geothermobacter hydrogeniphilus]
MTDGKKYSPPSKTVGDAAHAIARAGLSAVPYVGGPAAELFSALINPPLEKRRIVWMEEVGEALQMLEEQFEVSLEALQNNPDFIDTVMHASQIAVRNSQTEKRQALKNAILNTALPNPPEEAIRQICLDLIETFTDWHIRILKIFHNPLAWFEANNRPWPNMSIGGLSSILEAACPELKGRRDFYDQIWKDLYTRGLVNTDHMHTTMSGTGLTQQRTSGIGGALLSLIESPFEENNG